MIRKYTYSISTILIIATIGLSAWFLFSPTLSVPALLAFTVRYDGRAEIIGDLHLEAVLDPPVSQLGDLVALELSLKNDSLDPAAPEMLITLPDSLQVSVERFESGLTYNFQTGQISWRPVINPGGGTVQTTIYVTVLDVNPDAPEQLIDIALRHGDLEHFAELELWAGVPPQAEFSISPVRASVGQPVQLVAETAGSGPFSQIWALGDGRVVPAYNPVIIYPAVGTYNIELRVANPLTSVQVQQPIVIVPEPAAYLRLSDTSPVLNQEVEFTSLSGGQEPLQYLWDFGDGTFSTEKDPTHRYAVEGSYDVILTVRNDYGQAQNFVQVHVGQAPVADAIITDRGITGESISGQAYTDESIQTVIWDMGDGTIYEGIEVEHTYRDRGDYIVTVNAVNAFGNTSMTRFVRIDGGTYYIYIPSLINQLVATGEITNTAIIEETVSEADLLAQTIELVENEAEIVLAENPAIDALSPPEQLLWYINEARRQADLNPVSLVNSLSTASKVHTDDMAGNMFTSHTGSDGSAPYERLARVGYREGGYAGETTAWGFRYGREAVDFWLNSPPHRAILLNPLADQVGVAQTTNYNAPSVWYWTAEFASSYGSITAQMREAGVRLIKPAAYTVYEYGETAIFGWSWPLPLESDQRFVVYLRQENFETELGEIRQPIDNSIWYEYGYPISVVDMSNITGEYGWYVRLETASGDVLTRSEVRPLEITGQYPASPTPLPPVVSTPQPAVPTSTPVPNASPTPTATLEQAQPTVTPAVTSVPLGIGSTGSAAPTATPTPTVTPSPSPTIDSSAGSGG